MTQSLSEPMPAMGGLVRLLPRKKGIVYYHNLVSGIPVAILAGCGPVRKSDGWFVDVCGIVRHGAVRLNPMGGSFAGRSSLCWLAPLPGRGWRQVSQRLLVLPWVFHPYAKCKSHQITTVVNDISITYIIYQWYFIPKMFRNHVTSGPDPGQSQLPQPLPKQLCNLSSGEVGSTTTPTMETAFGGQNYPHILWSLTLWKASARYGHHFDMFSCKVVLVGELSWFKDVQRGVW